MSYLFGVLNQATDIWSGAVDVCAVRKKDDSILCTPFYIRFGRLKVLDAGEKTIRIMVNDKLTDMCMKIGANGIAYFVQETEDRVPEELQVTSPVVFGPENGNESIFDSMSNIKSKTSPKKSKKMRESPEEEIIFTFEDLLSGSRETSPANDHEDDDDEEVKGEVDHEEKVIESLSKEEKRDMLLYTTDEEASIQKIRNVESKSKSKGFLWGSVDWLFGSKAKKEVQKQVEEKKRPEMDAMFVSDPFIEQTFEEALTKKYNLRSNLETPEDEYISSSLESPKPTLSKKESYSLEKELSVSIPSDEDEENSYSAAENNLKSKFSLSSSPTLDVPKGKHTHLTPSLPPSMRKNIEEMHMKYNSLPSSFVEAGSRLKSPEVDQQSSSVGDDKNVHKKKIDQTTNETSKRTPSAPKVKPLETEKVANSGSWTDWIWGSSSKRVKDVVEDSTKPIMVSNPNKLKKLKKSSRPTSEQLKALDLKNGPNSLRFVVTSRVMGTQDILATLYLFDEDDKIVISDVDGTITRSDGLGHVLPMFGMDWAHQGICELYTKIVKNGYKVVYLTSRSIVQAAQTKQYIRGIEQKTGSNEYRLPDGPVIMSEDRLFACLHREVIKRKPEVFKIQVLKQILNLFPEEKRNKVFYAGFGNRVTDAISYRAVQVPEHRIYIISPSGKIVVYNSVGHNSYRDINAIVDQTFPDVRALNKTQSNVNYWQLGIPSVESIENMTSLSRDISFNINPDDMDPEMFDTSIAQKVSKKVKETADEEEEEDGEFNDEDLLNMSTMIQS